MKIVVKFTMVIPIFHANFCYTLRSQTSADTSTPEGDAFHLTSGHKLEYLSITYVHGPEVISSTVSMSTICH